MEPTRFSTFFRFCSLVTLLTFLPSVIAVGGTVPISAPVAEASELDREELAFTKLLHERSDLRRLTEDDLSHKSPGLRQRYANLPPALPSAQKLVEQYSVEALQAKTVVAQADVRAPFGPAEASGRLVAADALREQGNHYQAAQDYLGIVNDYGPCEESRRAHEGLMYMMYDALEGRIPNDGVAEFEQNVPAWESLSHLARYTLVGYYGERAELALSLGMKDEVTRCYEQTRLLAKRFLDDHPESAWQISTMIYYHDAARNAGIEMREQVIAEMRDLTQTLGPCMARLVAHCVLARDAYTVGNNMGEASIHCRNTLTEAENGFLQQTLADPNVYYWVKGQLHLYLGQAYECLGKYEEARQQYLRGVSDVGYRSITRDLLALRAVEMLEKLDPQNSDQAWKNYTQYMEEYPDSRVADRAWWKLANVYFLAGDYDNAALTYSEVIRRFPDSDSAKIAQSELDYLSEYLLGTAWVADGRKVTREPDQEELARLQWCGPKALERLLAMEGSFTTADELAVLGGTNEDGTSMFGLMEAAKAKGYALVGVAAPSADALQTPYIAHVDGDHYLLVTGVEGDKVYVADRDKPEEALTLQQFHSRWDGKALVHLRDASPAIQELTLAEAKSIHGGNWGEATADDNPIQNWSMALSPVLRTSLSEPGVHVWIDGFETAMQMMETDISLPVQGGLNLSFTRVFMNEKGYPRGEYMTVHPSAGGMGKGWTHNNNVHLKTSNENPPLTVTFYDELGAYRVYEFDSTAGGKNYYYRSSTGTTEERGNTLTRDTTSLKYTLEKPEGMKYKFSETSGSFARLESVVDIAGNALMYSYNGAIGTGVLTKIEAPAGDPRYLQLNYLSGRITKAELKDSGGTLLSTQYAYTSGFGSASGRLTKITDNCGATVKYSMAEYPNQPETLFMIEIENRVARTHTLAWTFSVTGGGVLEASKIDLTDAGGLKTTYDRSISTSVVTTTGWDGANNLSKNVLTPVSGDASRGRYLDSYKDVSNYGRQTYEYDGQGDNTQRLRADASVGATYTFNTSGHISTAANNTGETYTYSYTLNEQLLTKVEDPTMMPINFAYDSSQKLTGVQHPALTDDIIEYEYDSSGQLTQAQLPTGSVLFSWGARGEITSYTDQFGSTTSYELDNLGAVTRISYPDGTETEYVHSNCSCSPCGETSAVSSMVDTHGEQTTFTYDGNGNLTRTVSQGLEIVSEYDQMNRVTAVGPSGDPNLRVLTFYDKQGKITSEVQVDGTEVDQVYDFEGQLSMFSGPSTDLVYIFDSRGNLSQVIDSALTTEYQHDSNDRLTRIMYPGGKAFTYQYDNVGRVTKQGGGTAATIDPVRSHYDTAKGQLTKRTYGQDGSTQDAQYHRDGMGRLTKVTDWLSANGIRYEYNAHGSLTKYTNWHGGVQEYLVDSIGRLTQYTDAHGGEWNYLYSADYRITQLAGPGGKTWEFNYGNNGVLTSMAQPNAIIETVQYNSLNRITKISSINSAGSPPETVFQVTYELSERGKITQEANLDGSYWSYGYDSDGRLTHAERTSDLGHVAIYNYTYTPSGNLATKSEPFQESWNDGNYTGWTINAGSWSASNKYMENVYNGSAVSTFSRSMPNADAEVRFSYFNEDTSNTNYYFRCAVRNTANTRVDVRFFPDKAQLSEWNGSAWITLDLDSSVDSDQDTWYDVLVTMDGSNIKVHRAKRGEELSEILSTSSASVTTSNSMFVQAPIGAQIRTDNFMVLDGNSSSQWTYSYSGANELTQIANGPQGNTTTLAYDGRRRITMRTLGSMTSEYFYSYGNKLTRKTSTFPDEDSEVSFSYDGEGRLASKTNTASIRIFNNTLPFGISSEEDGNGNLSVTYPRIGGNVLGELHGTNVESASLAGYSKDARMSVRLVTNDNADALAKLEYAPYGSRFDSRDFDSVYQFGGQYWDVSANMHVYPFRFYSSDWSRWLTPDPAGAMDGLNDFLYVHSDPVNSIDSLGLSASPLPPIEHCQRPMSFVGFIPFATGILDHTFIRIGAWAWGFQLTSTVEAEPTAFPKNAYCVNIGKVMYGSMRSYNFHSSCFWATHLDRIKCVRDRRKDPAFEEYNWWSFNCRNWAEDVLEDCCGKTRVIHYWPRIGAWSIYWWLPGK